MSFNPFKILQGEISPSHLLYSYTHFYLFFGSYCVYLRAILFIANGLPSMYTGAPFTMNSNAFTYIMNENTKCVYQCSRWDGDIAPCNNLMHGAHLRTLCMMCCISKNKFFLALTSKGVNGP